MDAQTLKKEHRRDPRLHQAFPVKFQFLDKEDKPSGGIFEGFTRNVARGGMSIESRIERGKGTLKFISDKTKLKLTINIPPDTPPADSIATVKWLTKIEEPAFDVYFFGVKYDKIDDNKQRMIERYIERLRKRPRIFVYVFLLSTSFIIVFAYFLLVAR